MSWSTAQAWMFAKQLSQSAEGRAWSFFDERICESLLDAKVMDIILAQDSGEVNVEDVRDLRVAIANIMTVDDRAAFGADLVAGKADNVNAIAWASLVVYDMNERCRSFEHADLTHVLELGRACGAL